MKLLIFIMLSGFLYADCIYHTNKLQESLQRHKKIVKEKMSEKIYFSIYNVKRSADSVILECNENSKQYKIAKEIRDKIIKILN